MTEQIDNCTPEIPLARGWLPGGAGRGCRKRSSPSWQASTVAYVGHAENGRVMPSIDVVEAICGALGVTLGDLFVGIEAVTRRPAGP